MISHKFRLNISLSIILFSVITKIIYDIEVIQILPDSYFPGVSYGKEFDTGKYVFGWILFVLFLIPYSLCYRNISFSSVVIQTLFYINFMPVCSSFGINNTKIYYIVLYSIFWFVILVLFKIFEKKYLKIPKVSIFKGYNLIFSVILVIILLGIFLFTYSYNRLKVSFNLADVYLYREKATYIPAWIAWLKASFGAVFLPLLASVYIEKKKIFQFAIITYIEILLFSIGMDKSFLFNYFIGLSISIINFKRISARMIIPLIIFIGNLIALLEYFVFGTWAFFMLLIRRIFYLPTWLNYLYIEYFVHNDNLLFTQGIFILSSLLPDIINAPFISSISNYYFKGKITNPNTGMLAFDFMQINFGSAISLPFLFLLILMNLENLFKKMSLRIKYIAGLIFAMLLTNVSILSRHFCLAVGIAFLLLYLLSKTKLARESND